MDFEDKLLAFAVSDHEDVGFLAHTDLIADGVDGISLLMRVKC